MKKLIGAASACVYVGDSDSDRYEMRNRATDRNVRIGYLNLFSGVSGNMLMRAVVDAGVNPSTVITGLESLELDESDSFDAVSNKGICTTGFVAETGAANRIGACIRSSN